MLIYMEVFDFDLGPQMDLYSIIIHSMYKVPTKKIIEYFLCEENRWVNPFVCCIICWTLSCCC